MAENHQIAEKDYKFTRKTCHFKDKGFTGFTGFLYSLFLKYSTNSPLNYRKRSANLQGNMYDTKVIPGSISFLYSVGYLEPLQTTLFASSFYIYIIKVY